MREIFGALGVWKDYNILYKQKQYFFKKQKQKKKQSPSTDSEK